MASNQTPGKDLVLAPNPPLTPPRLFPHCHLSQLHWWGLGLRHAKLVQYCCSAERAAFGCLSQPDSWRDAFWHFLGLSLYHKQARNCHV